MTTTIRKTRSPCSGARARLARRVGSGLAAALGAYLGMQGCTFIGTGVGAAIPRYERVNETSAPHRPPGSGYSARSTRADEGEGEKRKVGSYWWVGTLAGLAVDVAVVAAAASFFAPGPDPSPSSRVGGSGFGGQ